MKRNDWETAFGDVPDAFSDTVRTTVTRMQRARRSHTRPRLAVIMAAAIVILAGTAFALTQLGVLDTLQANLRAFLQPGADTLVQTDITQTAQQPSHADFTVEEAINDGQRIYAVVRVHGGNDALLMDCNAEPSWPTDWWQGGESADTYSKRASDADLALVQACLYPVDADGNELTAAMPEIHYDSEDILYTISFPATGTDSVLLLNTYEVFADDKPHSERLSTGKLTMTVPVTDARTVYAAETPVALPEGNLTLTQLTVEQTPVATYVTCEYEAADGAPDLTYVQLRDGIWADWLDANGQPYPTGDNGSKLEQADTGHTRLAAVYRAFETLPETITLRFFDGMTGETFDTVTLALRPITKEED